MGVELEFVILDVADQSKSDCRSSRIADLQGLYSHNNMASAMRGSRGVSVRDCVVTLQEAGIDVEQYHAESAPLQYEIALGPASAVTAVDRAVQAQEIIRTVASSRGFAACFLPSPFGNGLASGLHAHVSMAPDPGVLEQQCRQQEDEWLAGIQHRLPLLCTIGMPSEQSY